MPPKLKLVYFNIRGRGELIRLTLHAGGVAFTDERIPYEEWAQHKNQAPNGQIPYIVVDGKMYGEVLPIVRFIGKKCGLMGKKEEDQIYVEILLEQIHKFRDQLSRPKIDSLLNKGQKVTAADLSVWDTVDVLVSEKPDLLGVYPQLLAHRARIQNLPKLKKYLDTRPPDQQVPKNPKEPMQPQPQPTQPTNTVGSTK